MSGEHSHSSRSADFESSLSPEQKRRTDAIKAQIGRVDKVLDQMRAQGINVTDLTILKEGKYFLVSRSSHNDDCCDIPEESITVTNPPYVDDTEDYKLSGYLGVEPIDPYNPAQATFTNFEDNIEPGDFNVAFYNMKLLLDHLGFPPAPEQPTLSPDDIDGLHVAGIRFVDPRTYALVTTEGNGSMGNPTAEGIARSQAQVLLERSGSLPRPVPADMDDLKS